MRQRIVVDRLQQSLSAQINCRRNIWEYDEGPWSITRIILHHHQLATHAFASTDGFLIVLNQTIQSHRHPWRQQTTTSRRRGVSRLSIGELAAQVGG
ncbi:uncharacterized protein LOC126410290 isoform X2 [Nymphaea colorata]|uniref:uncharacterized protein LOC126410290 isoform X2 n=1 Tax=Nymphaea colorata TaxID=210225 RepID=UPI00214EAE2A|nr:uncharacterized protein LOC126410290 isoform X2 [Nymphaea colorata]